MAIHRTKAMDLVIFFITNPPFLDIFSIAKWKKKVNEGEWLTAGGNVNNL
jgi:hypothetical protein